MSWTESGALWSLECYVRGRMHGRRLTFHPDGAKQSEAELENGRGVGTIKRWSESGTLIEETRNKAGIPTFPGLYGDDVRQEACFARVASLRTRQNR